MPSILNRLSTLSYPILPYPYSSSDYGTSFIAMGTSWLCELGILSKGSRVISNWLVYISRTESWKHSYDGCFQKRQRHLPKIIIGKRHEAYYDTDWT